MEEFRLQEVGHKGDVGVGCILLDLLEVAGDND